MRELQAGAKSNAIENAATSLPPGTASEKASSPTSSRVAEAVPTLQTIASGAAAGPAAVIAESSTPARSSFLSDAEGVTWFTICRNRKAGMLPTLPEIDFLVELVERAIARCA